MTSKLGRFGSYPSGQSRNLLFPSSSKIIFSKEKQVSLSSFKKKVTVWVNIFRGSWKQITKLIQWIWEIANIIRFWTSFGKAPISQHQGYFSKPFPAFNKPIINPTKSEKSKFSSNISCQDQETFLTRKPFAEKYSIPNKPIWILSLREVLERGTWWKKLQ